MCARNGQTLQGDREVADDIRRLGWQEAAIARTEIPRPLLCVGQFAIRPHRAPLPLRHRKCNRILWATSQAPLVSHLDLTSARWGNHHSMRNRNQPALLYRRRVPPERPTRFFTKTGS